MNDSVSVSVDFFEFDELQLTFVHSLAAAIKGHLEKLELPRETTVELTTQILFSVTAILDGSTPLPESANAARPFLTFALDEDATTLLATEHCTGMHEYAVGCAEDAFEDEEP